MAINKTNLKRYAALMVLGLLMSGASAQQNLQGGGWTYNPAIDGMQDLRALKPIEGCNEPGGLRRINSTDEPGSSSPFWCGEPPFCLTDAAAPTNEQCTIVPFSRRDPRGDPNGRPGANGVRDPDDLRCVNTGLQPIAGRCPMPPQITATLNGQQALTIQEGNQVTLAVSSPHATQLRQSCVGVNTAYTPFNTDNLDTIAGRDGSHGPGTLLNVGNTSCTLTATNVRGSVSTTVVSVVTARPVPPPPVTTPPGGVTGGGTEIPVVQNCTARPIRLTATTYECYARRNWCDYRLPNLENGASRTVSGTHGDYCGGGAQAELGVTCSNGSYVVTSHQCNMWDGGG